MRITRKTVFMAVIALALLGLNLLDRGSGERIAQQLPIIRAVDRDEVTRIEMTSAYDKVVLEKISEETVEGSEPVWHVTAPYEADADQVAVRTLLQNFRKDVPVDVRVDTGNLESYGLDANDGIVVEVFTWAKTPDISFTVGNDAPGGSTFIRLSGDEAVYRARVGGRHRYDKPAADWRNRVLLAFEKKSATAISVAQGGAVTLQAARAPSTGIDQDGNAIPGPWELVPDPGWATDTLAIDALVQNLGSLRAGDILGPDFDGGFSPPAALVEVVLEDGSKRALEVGSRAVEGAAYARVRGNPTVYRVAAGPVERARQPAAEFRDRTMLSFSRTDVDTLAYETDGVTVLLQQDLATSLWNVIQPANVDLDIRMVFFAVNTLGALRADEFSEVPPAEAGLEDPAARFVAQLLDGSTRVLEVGRPTTDSAGRPAFFVRVGGDRQVYLLRDATVEKLRQGFGQR